MATSSGEGHHEILPEDLQGDDTTEPMGIDGQGRVDLLPGTCKRVGSFFSAVTEVGSLG